jgi:hypothetical protein
MARIIQETRYQTEITKSASPSGEGEKAKSITPIITGRVTSVVFEDGKAKLKVNDEQTINLEDLKEIAWR